MNATQMTRKDIDQLLDQKLKTIALGMLSQDTVEKIVESRYIAMSIERDAQDTLRIKTAIETDLKKWAAIFGVVNVSAIIAGAIAIAVYIFGILPNQESVKRQVEVYIGNSLKQEPAEFIKSMHQATHQNYNVALARLEDKSTQLNHTLVLLTSLINEEKKKLDDFKKIDRYQEANAQLQGAFVKTQAVLQQIESIKTEFFSNTANGKIVDNTYREISIRLAQILRNDSDILDRLYAEATSSIPVFFVRNDAGCPPSTKQRGQFDAQLRRTVFHSLRGVLKAVCDSPGANQPSACGPLKPTMAELEKIDVQLDPSAVFKVCERDQ